MNRTLIRTTLAVFVLLVTPAVSEAAVVKGNAFNNILWSVNRTADSVYGYGGNDTLYIDYRDYASCGAGTDTVGIYYYTMSQAMAAMAMVTSQCETKKLYLSPNPL